MLVRMQKYLISHTLPVGLYKGTATLKDSLASSLKRNILTSWLINHTSENLSQRNGNLCPHTQKTVYVNIHSTFICNKDYRYGNKPYDGSMAKQTVILSNYGRLLSNKKEQFTSTAWMEFKGILPEKKNQKRLHAIGFHLYNILEWIMLWRWK